MNTRNTAVLLVMAAALAACSGDATAPTSTVEPSSMAAYEGSMQGLTGTDTVKFSITIDPSRLTTYYLGAGNSLVFPAGSLCSLYSSYGASEWDKPCTKATSSVTVNVKAWLDKYGKARVDFDKHVRFVPSSNPSQWVVITFADMEAALDPFFNILYCPGSNSWGSWGSWGSSSTNCYDESKSDPSLLTVRNPLTGKVTRRIKHFSGYNVAAGRESDGEGFTDGDSYGSWNLSMPSFSIAPGDLQLDTVEEIQEAYPRLGSEEAEAMLRAVRAAKKSGYILASG